MRRRSIRGMTDHSSGHVLIPDVTADALARYENNTNNGTTWFDIMPTPANAVSTVAAWPVFDETNPDKVIIGTPAKLDFPGAFTLTTWGSQDRDASQQSEVLLSRDDSNGLGDRCYFFNQRDDTGVPRFSLWTGAGLQNCQGVGDYADGAWHFYACVNEGLGGGLRLYVDGVLDAATVGTGGALNIVAARENAIGINSDGPPDALSGRCDTARYYGRALSADEILRDYKTGLISHQ